MRPFSLNREERCPEDTPFSLSVGPKARSRRRVVLASARLRLRRFAATLSLNGVTSTLHPLRRYAATLSLTGVAFLSALTTSACLEPGDPYLAERDNEPPTFVGTSPQPGGTLNVDQAIVITFSEKMDPRSLRPGIWLLLDNERVPVVVEIPPEDTDLPDIALQNVPYRVSVRGEQPLLPNTEYVLVLDTVLTDTAGNQLAGPDGGLTQRALPYRTNP